MTERQYSIGDLINLSAPYLRDKGCPSARLDAEILLGHVLGLDRLALYLNFDKPLNQEEVDAYRILIGRRGRRIPVAYLTGEKEFYSLPFKVTSQVLIPRPETELLVDKVLELVDFSSPVHILEMGTGSGAIAVALARQDPNILVTAVDISQGALKAAQSNIERLEVAGQVNLIQSDLFQNIEGEYALICANPPYIPRAELASAQEEIGFEPALALDGGADGLAFYRRLFPATGPFLKRPGFVVLEIGWNQGDAVRGLGEQNGFRWLETMQDYGGQDRVVVFQWD